MKKILLTWLISSFYADPKAISVFGASATPCGEPLRIQVRGTVGERIHRSRTTAGSFSHPVLRCLYLRQPVELPWCYLYPGCDPTLVHWGSLSPAVHNPVWFDHRRVLSLDPTSWFLQYPVITVESAHVRSAGVDTHASSLVYRNTGGRTDGHNNGDVRCLKLRL